MKKRLLSAALALAMVLTLLPTTMLTASAAVSSGVDGDPASYHATADSTVKAGVWTAPGWYVKHDTKDADGKITATTYELIDSGFVVGNKYYSTFPMNAAGTAPLSTSFVAIGAVTADLKDSTSVSVDVYGGVSSTSVSLTGAKLTSITVNDTKYDAEVRAGRRAATQRGEVTLPTTGGWSDVTKSVTINLTNVVCTNGITVAAGVKGNVSRRISLTNASIGAVSLDGTDTSSTAHPKVSAAQTISTIRSTTPGAPGNAITGAVSLTGAGSSLTMWDTALDTNTVTMTGTGVKVQADGYTTGTGDITLTGSTDSEASKTAAAPSVIVNGTSLGAIAQGAEQLTSNYTINVNSQASVASVAIANANVTVNGGTVTGAVTMGNGSLKVQNAGKIGSVAFSATTAGVISEFSVSGSYNQVGTITTSNVTFTKVDFPADNTNKFTGTAIDLGSYGGKGIKGGSFENKIANTHMGYLADNLAYVVKLASPAGYYAYFDKAKLTDAIVAAGPINAVKAGAGIALRGVDPTKYITLSVGGVEMASVGFGVAPSSIILPGIVNGADYVNWTQTGTTAKPGVGTTYATGTEFVRSTLEDITLDAQVVNGEVTKINNATIAPTGSTNPDVAVRLNGNVITLSGAATSTSSGMAGFTVNLETDILDGEGKLLQVPITINWNNSTGKATFARDVAVGYGITFPDENTLKLNNGVTYTVTGTGLKELVTTFDTYEDSTEIQITVNAAGYTTDNQKKALIDALLGVTPGTTSYFKWNASPAVRQAINAAKATITDSQVTSWKTSAQRTAWQKTSSISPTTADLAGTGYSKVMLIPYLYMNVTKSEQNNALTATLTPYYRVEVWHTSDTDGTSTTNPPIVVQTGRTLGTLLNDLTGNGMVGVQLKLGKVNATATMHQDSKYAYVAVGNEWTITHAGSAGLGTVVIDTEAPSVELTRAADAYDANGNQMGAAKTYYYDNLQAAIDDTLPQVAGKEDKVTVKRNYTGTGVITMNGAARLIEVETEGNTVISTNTKDIVTVKPVSGHEYTVQLLKDTAAPGQNIVVASATGGSATVSANPATAGQSVTVTLTPATGYVSQGVAVKTNTGATVTASGSGNTYTFTMPSNVTTVTVTPTFAVGDNKAVFAVNNSIQGTAAALTGTSDGKAAQGASVPVVVSPKSGYRTIGLTARGNNGTTASVTRTGTNNFNVTVPSGATTVTVTPSFDVDTGTPFIDVLSNHWASSYVTWAYNNKYIEGTGDYTYSPSNYMTIGEVASMLYKAAGSPSVAGMRNPYSNLTPTSHWAYNAIIWAANQGLLDTSTGTINGFAYATRAQIVEILYRRAGSPAVYGSSGFTDVASNASYARAVTWARQKGLSNGYGSNSIFRPGYAVTRAEMAAFLQRAFSKVG